MKILVAKSFGLGNAVMAVPLVKALRQVATKIDFLVGSTPDDGGSWNVLRHLTLPGEKVYVNTALEDTYDVAIMAIPSDGRWRNGIHFNAARVMDGRPRPDPSTFGFSSWKKHEVEYQLENAYQLGVPEDVRPDCAFLPFRNEPANSVYIGVGYKKDAAGYWKAKHWGNQNYADLIKLLLGDGVEKVVLTGDAGDMSLSINPIRNLLEAPLRSRVEVAMENLDSSFQRLSKCSAYIGNDTGMMHVAASLDMTVVGLFFLPNSEVKNPPWCRRGKALVGPVTPEQVLTTWRSLR